MIGLKQNSNGETGVVWVRTRGLNQHDELVMEYVRWVMVRCNATPMRLHRKRLCQRLKPVLSVDDLVIPKGLDFTNYNFELAGEPHCWGDYEVAGKRLTTSTVATIEEAEHMMATRLWQNTAKVHFDAHVPA